MKRDLLGLWALIASVLIGFYFIIDWSKFSHFGQTPVRQVEPKKRTFKGFGLQCSLDDEVVPCMYYAVITKGASND